MAMLLSSYGAARGPAYLDAPGMMITPSEAEKLHAAAIPTAHTPLARTNTRASRPPRRTRPRPCSCGHSARDGGHLELLAWLEASRRYTALHHVRALTPRRAVDLLRAGCSPHAKTAQLYMCSSSTAELGRHRWLRTGRAA